jgi:hypothetical protein
MAKGHKVRNWYVDDAMNRDWLKALPAIREAMGKDGASIQEVAEEEVIEEAETETKSTTYTPPKSAQANAARVLKWRDEHPDEIQGMTRVGWTRANQLAKGEALSLDTVKRMAQFARHRENANVSAENESTPWKDAGRVAWLGWGGEEGIAWAKRVSEREGKKAVDDISPHTEHDQEDKMNQEQKARGEGKGQGNEPQGDGGVAVCVCPKCGREYEHDRGTPCNELECEDCEVALVGTQTDRAETAAVMAGVDAQVKATKATGKKVGRRVRTDKVSLITRIKKEFDDLAAAIQDLLGWARYEDGGKEMDEDAKAEALRLLNAKNTRLDALRTMLEEGEMDDDALEEVAQMLEADTLANSVMSGVFGLVAESEETEEEDVTDETEEDEETKAAKYAVQPFHSGWAKADENAKWSFSAADGNALTDKGGWDLYKQAHLVADTSEGATPENKDAYTYPVAKLVDGKMTYFLKAAQAVYAGLRGGARAADLPKDVEKRVLAPVKKIYAAFGRDTEQLEVKGHAFAFKSISGDTWWFQSTTNAFRDRENEIFSTKALEAFVNRHRDDTKKGEFWYRHIPGTKFGDVRWQAMVGRFLVQAGPFDDTEIGNAFKEFFESHPEGHPDIAPNGWGTSHGYKYRATDRWDGVYDWLEIKESTVLPLHVAANVWSPSPIMVRRKAMNTQEKQELTAIGGNKLVDLVMQAQTASDRLEKEVDFKSVAPAVQLASLVEAVEDDAVKALLTKAAELMEGDAEDEAEKEEGEDEEPIKGGGVEGTESPEETKQAAITREEIAEAMKTVTDLLREEMTKAIGEQVTEASKATESSIVEALKPLVADVKELRKEDDEKVAQKAEMTPAASLADLVKSVIGSKETEVKEGDDLAGKGPQATPPGTGQDGLPSMLGMWMSNADQQKRQ